EPDEPQLSWLSSDEPPSHPSSVSSPFPELELSQPEPSSVESSAEPLHPPSSVSFERVLDSECPHESSELYPPYSAPAHEHDPPAYRSLESTVPLPTPPRVVPGSGLGGSMIGRGTSASHVVGPDASAPGAAGTPPSASGGREVPPSGSIGPIDPAS